MLVLRKQKEKVIEMNLDLKKKKKKKFFEILLTRDSEFVLDIAKMLAHD
jgi:hypothetical protein